MKQKVILTSALCLISSASAFAQIRQVKFEGETSYNRMDSQKALELAEEESQKSKVNLQVEKLENIIDADYNERIMATKPFKLSSIEFDNAEFLNQAKLKEIENGFIGKEISGQDLLDLSIKIAQLANSQNLLACFPFVPPQDFKDGKLKFQILSGGIRQVLLSNNAHSNDLIVKYANKITSFKGPLNTLQVNRYIRLIDEIPGISIVKINLMPLAPKDRVDGKIADLQLFVTKKKNSVSLSATNEIEPAYGNMKFMAGVGYYSLFNKGEQIMLSAASSNIFSAYKSASFSYNHPINTHGTRIIVTGTIAKKNSTKNVAESMSCDGADECSTIITPSTSTRVIEFKVKHPFILRKGFKFEASAGTSLESGDTIKDNQKPKTHYRDVNIGCAIQFKDFMDSMNILSYELTKGLSYKNETAKKDVNKKFLKHNFNLLRVDSLPGDFNLLSNLFYQFSNHVVPDKEKITFGSHSYVRGYSNYHIASNKGFASNFELSKMFMVKNTYLRSVRPYVFFDYGKILNKKDVKNSISSVSSIGLGLSGSIIGLLNFKLDFAKPLKAVPIKDKISNKTVKQKKLQTVFSVEHKVEW